MGLSYNSKISKDGLVFLADPANLTKHGSSPYVNLAGVGTITNVDFTATSNVWRSNANPTTGAGTSELAITGITVDTGSFTMIAWVKRTSDANVGVNNNYRSVFMNGGTSQSPFGILMEETNFLQFSLVTSLRQYRYLGANFTQFAVPLNTWIQIVFAYNHVIATGYAYSNGVLTRSGNMSTTADLSVSALPGEKVTSIVPATVYGISNNNNVSDPNGSGCFPGDFGPCLIYNRALTATEVFQNFQAYRERYSL